MNNYCLKCNCPNFKWFFDNIDYLIPPKLKIKIKNVLLFNRIREMK